MTNVPLSRPIVPPAREDHRPKFSQADNRQIVEEASQPGANLTAMARELNRIAELSGYPGTFVSGNGPEHTSNDILVWQQEHAIEGPTSR